VARDLEGRTIGQGQLLGQRVRETSQTEAVGSGRQQGDDSSSARLRESCSEERGRGARLQKDHCDSSRSSGHTVASLRRNEYRLLNVSPEFKAENGGED
jgi:hypothetical protein